MPPINRQSKATVRRQQQAAERRAVRILIVLVLIVFSLGTIFGCFLSSLFSPKPAKAAEEPTPIPVAQSTAPFRIPIQRMVITRVQEIKKVDCKLSAELQTAMYDACEKYDIPFALALAVAEQESRFNPDAESSTNDYGLMQINQINFGWLRKNGIEPLDHKGNIEAGVMMLSQAVKKYGDYELALMAYNCGDTGARKLWNQNIYSTKYSASTLERFDKWNAYTGGI